MSKNKKKKNVSHTQVVISALLKDSNEKVIKKWTRFLFYQVFKQLDDVYIGFIYYCI